jgi:hypothetical protein
MTRTAKTRTAKSILGTLTLATLLLGAVAAHAADQRDFWIDNETGNTVAVFLVSPHGSTTWYPVPNSTTRSGNRTTVNFNSSFSGSCFFDFKLEYTNGTYQSYTAGQNLCDTIGVRFYPHEAVSVQI